jgi:CubicO group peptidase (beta-lactamase class C family)
MAPELAASIRTQPQFVTDTQRLGPVRSIAFKGVGFRGLDQYEVTTRDGLSRWAISVTPDGKTAHLFLRRLEQRPPKALSEPEFKAELEGKVAELVSNDEFAGAVLVAKDYEPVFQAAYGLADRERNTQNTLGTQFRIASLNKMFTAVAILQLVQAGRITLDATLDEYLPSYPNAELARSVTIHHLLTHTGGTGDIFGPLYAQHRQELHGLQDYVTLLGPRGTELTPGSEWRYSNYGFILLGLVIEKVSGQSYYDYVAEHVYRPAHMTATSSLPESASVPRRAVGYMRFRPERTPKPKPGQSWWPNTDTLPHRGTSAGGGYSTVTDLLAFARALQNHELLDAEHTALLTQGKVDMPGGDKYAYGFVEQEIAGVTCFGHGGGAPGMNGYLQICPPAGAAPGYVVAVLSNLGPPAASRIAEFAQARLPLSPPTEVTGSAPAPASPACQAVLFDDLEGSRNQPASPAPPGGAWHSFKDQSGTTLSPKGPFAPSLGGANGSKHAAHIHGRAANAERTWAGFAVKLAEPVAPVDVSSWKGLCFKARGTGRARLSLPDVSTDPAGNVCKWCHNGFGADFSLTADWREHCFAFDALTQQCCWGEPHPALTTQKVFAFVWTLHTPGAEYDLWVDDIRLSCE